MSEEGEQKSWFERISTLLLREPQDRAQLLSLLRHATEKKILDVDALTMFEGVLQVSEMQVREIMVPRSQMVVIPHQATPEQFLPIVIESQHSRFPVVGENRDEVIGILLAKDLLRFTVTSPKVFNIQDWVRPAVFIPESKRLNVLLREFRLSRNHIAIVVDEYGGIAGLVTIEDVLEQIVGEIEDEYDINEKQTHIQKISANQYNVKAITSVEDFNQYFAANFNEKEFDTIGGLVLQKFGHLPKRGESLKIKKFTFKVLHADNRRIRLLRVNVARSSKSKKTTA